MKLFEEELHLAYQRPPVRARWQPIVGQFRISRDAHARLDVRRLSGTRPFDADIESIANALELAHRGYATISSSARVGSTALDRRGRLDVETADRDISTVIERMADRGYRTGDDQ